MSKNATTFFFKKCAPDPGELVRKKDFVVGIPLCFSIYTLWPLYSWFFHSLGVETFFRIIYPMKEQRGWKAAIVSRRKLLTELFRISLTAIWITSSCPILEIWKVMKRMPGKPLSHHARPSLLYQEGISRKSPKTNIYCLSSALCMAWRKPVNLLSRRGKLGFSARESRRCF